VPGSAQGLYLIVSDLEAAREDLRRRGVAISEAFHDATDVHAGPDQPYLFGRLRVSPDPEHRSYRTFASFSDPDGNGWLLEEITTRLPGASTPPRLHSALQPTWRARSNVRPPPTASTRNAPGSATRTGPTFTPRTWWRSSPAESCRRAHAHRRLAKRLERVR